MLKTNNTKINHDILRVASLTIGDRLGVLKMHCILGNQSKLSLIKYVAVLQADAL